MVVKKDCTNIDGNLSHNKPGGIMRNVFKMVSALMLVSAFGILAAGGGEGRIQFGLLPPDQQQASTADWYTMKSYHISGSGKTILNVDSTWDDYLLKGFINQSTASNAAVKIITQVGDTAIIPIPPAGFIWKLPVIAKLFATGTSDSLVYMFQKK